MDAILAIATRHPGLGVLDVDEDRPPRAHVVERRCGAVAIREHSIQLAAQRRRIRRAVRRLSGKTTDEERAQRIG